MAGDSRAMDRAFATTGGDGFSNPIASAAAHGVRLDRVWTPRRAAVLLMAGAAVLYARTVTFPLVYEDLTDPSTVFRAWEWPGWHRLLTILSMRLSIALSGMEPWGFHLVNVALHLLNGALIWRFVTGWAGVFALGLYLLHPLQVESVAYVSSRSDLLLTTCVLCGVWAVERRSWIGVVSAAALAVLAKETGVMALPLVVAYAVFRGRALPVWLYLVPLPALTIVAWKFGDLLTLDPSYTLTELVKAGWMLSRIAWPLGLSIDHDWAWITPDVMALAMGTLLAALALVARLQVPRMAFVLAWIGLALAPRLLVPLVEGLHEHHFALPMAGLALGIGASLTKDTQWASD